MFLASTSTHIPNVSQISSVCQKQKVVETQKARAILIVFLDHLAMYNSGLRLSHMHNVRHIRYIRHIRDVWYDVLDGRCI